MPLVDASILSRLNTNPNPIPAAQQGAAFGQGLVQFGQQQQDRGRQQAFMAALDEVVQQAGDFTTPEGQKKIVMGLAAKGFGQEAQEIAAKLPKPAKTEFQFKEAGDDYGAFDPNKGTFNKLGTKPKEPEKSSSNPKTEKGRDGYYHVWNPDTKKFENTGLLAPNDDETPHGGMAGVHEKQYEFTNIRNTRRDFEDNDFIRMIPKTDRYYSSATRAWNDYSSAQESQKQGKRQFLDQALVYSFNKLMEETSAVMPGEFERTAMGQSVASDVVNKIRQGFGGGLKLDDTQRQAMINTMKIFRDGVIENARPVYKQFSDEAQILSPDNPNRIVGGYKKYFADANTSGAVPADSSSSGWKQIAPGIRVRAKP